MYTSFPGINVKKDMTDNNAQYSLIRIFQHVVSRNKNFHHRIVCCSHQPRLNMHHIQTACSREESRVGIELFCKSFINY